MLTVFTKYHIKMLISCAFQDKEEDRYSLSAQFDEGVNKKLYGTVRKINKESSTVVVHFKIDGQLAIVPLNAIHAESIDNVSDYGSYTSDKNDCRGK